MYTRTLNSLIFAAVAVCFAKNTEATTTAAAKKKTPEAPETPATETPVAEPVVDALDAAMVEIPAKICVQIGQRKRYFDDKEQARAALLEFNERQNKPKGASRVVLTAEQKAERAANRAILMAYASKQGLEGKKQAMLANTLEDLVATIPTVLSLIAGYNASTPDVVTEDTPEVVDTVAGTAGVEQGVEPEVTTSADPLAEFGM